MKLEGWLQKSNSVSIKRSDNKMLRSRILLDNYQIDTWVNADSTIKVEISVLHRMNESKVIAEGTIQSILEEI